MTFENWALKAIVSPQANICGKDSLRPPGTHFFLIPPFQNLGLKVVPPPIRKEGADTVSKLPSTLQCLWNISFFHLADHQGLCKFSKKFSSSLLFLFFLRWRTSWPRYAFLLFALSIKLSQYFIRVRLGLPCRYHFASLVWMQSLCNIVDIY